jgi:hypothetical protein
MNHNESKNESNELDEYLQKLAHLVPELQRITQQEDKQKCNKVLFPLKNDNTSTISTNNNNKALVDQLQNFNNLNVSNKNITDLQILQSVLDYIADLKKTINDKD